MAKEMRKYVEKVKTKLSNQDVWEPTLPLKIVLTNAINTTLYTKLTIQNVMFVTLVKVEEDCMNVSKSTQGETKIPMYSNIH